MRQKKHKAASEVTVASMTEAGLLQQVAQRYWLPFAGFALAVTGWILYRQYRAESTQAGQLAQWDEFGAVVSIDPTTGYPSGAPTALAAAATRLADRPVSAYLQLTEAISRREQGDWQGARSVVASLRSSHPDTAYLHQTIMREDGSTATLLDELEASIDSSEAWETSAGSVFSNPPLPDGAPRVRIETSAGDLVVGLYANLAPQHVENFLAHVDSGLYVGTRFHRIGANFMIQGGDPNSKQDDDRSTWGQGGDDVEKIAPEPNGLLHFRGVLAAAKKPGDKESSGTQFYITTGTPHHLDGVHTIFGALIEGDSVADAISLAPMEPGTDRPVEPVEVLSTTRL